MTEITSLIHMTQHDSTSTPKQDYPQRKRPTLKAGEWYETGQLSPEEAKRRQLFYQKMAYIEMKKLRHNHTHA